jgi:hypothetical protein
MAGRAVKTSEPCIILATRAIQTPLLERRLNFYSLRTSRRKNQQIQTNPNECRAECGSFFVFVRVAP